MATAELEGFVKQLKANERDSARLIIAGLSDRGFGLTLQKTPKNNEDQLHIGMDSSDRVHNTIRMTVYGHIRFELFGVALNLDQKRTLLQKLKNIGVKIHPPQKYNGINKPNWVGVEFLKKGDPRIDVSEIGEERISPLLDVFEWYRGAIFSS